MDSQNIEAVIIPQADPHLSEYLASHWQARRWFSGFSGSAGDLVVTAEDALLWTDSRYFLQAARQLEGSGIALMKDGVPGTPSIKDWLADNLKPGSMVGLDGMLFSAPALDDLKSRLAVKNITVDCHFDAVSPLWNDRPEMPMGEIYIHDAAYAGESARSKIDRIRQFMKSHDCQATFISALDEIAWTLNIRCDDVKHTPVATAYLLISNDSALLFIAPEKVSADVLEYLNAEGVETRPYDTAATAIALLTAKRIMIEPAHTSGAMLDTMGKRAVAVKFSPASIFKAQKNDVQLQGIRKAMERDGAALVKSFMEIEKRVREGIATTEMDVADILRRNRSRSPMFRDESFGTIAGYGPHGAIVHYEADAESNSTLAPTGLLLVDSGAQYLDGTTDITRTICLGTPTAEEKRDFTLVMKGHISLACQMFPEDTRGAQLDALARRFLWNEGLTYLHGTGHGVGHFLGVHEGPQSIRLNYVDFPLLPGMITSNEPGLYRSGVHGIRCENLVLTVKALENEFGTFMRFETLTLFPFDLTLFDTSIMTDEEISWVNNYHTTVRERLTPLLDEEAAAWLASKTQPLKK